MNGGKQGMNREKMRELGVDIDSALERLGENESLLKRLLKEFLVDPAFYRLIRIGQICLRVSLHVLDEKLNCIFRNVGKKHHKLITAHSECSGVLWKV